MSEIADRVRKAADHIEKYGLHKGTATALDWPEDDPDYDWEAGVVEQGVPCCTLGAVWAYNEGNSPDGLHLFFSGRVKGFRSIVDWNDAPERTADEVVGFLRAFADKLEAGDE